MSTSISGHTQLICLLGSPVSHSISPAMHNESFHTLGLDYRYLAFDVRESCLESAVKGLKAMNVKGFNLTMPHKNHIVRYLDELSPEAALIGSVNTVLNDNGRFIGYNTDGIGYMRAAKEAGCEPSGKKITLLGSGGASTAILVQAALDGAAEISQFCRKESPFYPRAGQLLNKLRNETGCTINLYTYDDPNILAHEIADSYLLIHGTSLGMAPDINSCILPDNSMLPEDIIVSDIIYNPRKTKLLQMAEQKGLKTFNGLYMLLYQGAEAFRIWTGKEMPVSLIKQKYFYS